MNPAVFRRFLRPSYLLAALFGLTFLTGLVWRLSPYYERFDFHDLGEWLAQVRGHPWTPVVVVAIFVLGGFVLFAHAVILWATVLSFDPWTAVLYCELGSIASALTLYALGRVLRPGVVRRLAGSYLDDVSQALGRRGRLTLTILHWFPICPFSLLNLLAGSTHIRFADFWVGTLIGITPGIFFISFFGHQVRWAVTHPRWENFAGVAAFLIVAALALRLTRRMVKAEAKKPKS